MFVTRRVAGSVVEIDPASGSQQRSIDLSSLRVAGGTIEPRRMLFAEGRLFVQVARSTATGTPDGAAFAVIDTTSGTLETTIELEVTHAGMTKLGLNPDFAMVLDPTRNHLYVALSGNRPADTGLLVRIDTATLAIHDYKLAESGFQGALVFGEPFTSLYMLYHTSTPVTSSHLFAYTVEASGALVSTSGGTLNDAFDGIDALTINAGGTLVAMANTCSIGFCIGGAGITFIEAATRKVLPKLMKELIGFEPAMVQLK
jgi:hypothetical protein